MKIRPIVTRDDIRSVSKHLQLPEEKFISRYLELNEVQEYLMAEIPCPFLKDKRCSMYEVRPEDCRSYPLIWKNGFVTRLMGVLNNYSFCPIVFNVYEQLKSEFKYNA